MGYSLKVFSLPYSRSFFLQKELSNEVVVFLTFYAVFKVPSAKIILNAFGVCFDLG